MNNPSLYGELSSEKLAADNQVSNQIVKEINNFGISERQRWMIIYKLALEIEDVNDMKNLTNYVKQAKGNEIFISKIYGADEPEEEINS